MSPPLTCRLRSRGLNPKKSNLYPDVNPITSLLPHVPIQATAAVKEEEGGSGARTSFAPHTQLTPSVLTLNLTLTPDPNPASGHGICQAGGWSRQGHLLPAASEGQQAAQDLPLKAMGLWTGTRLSGLWSAV